jgi:hypothetical protein
MRLLLPLDSDGAGVLLGLPAGVEGLAVGLVAGGGVLVGGLVVGWALTGKETREAKRPIAIHFKIFVLTFSWIH